MTFNGEHYDLKRLGEFAGLHGPLPLQGTHSDMRLICLSDRIWGADLQDTYRMHLESRPAFPDPHEGSNHMNTYMTFKLWQNWKPESSRSRWAAYRRSVRSRL